MHAWASDHFLVPVPAGHRFPNGKFAAVRESLLRDGVLAPERVHRSEPAPLEWLARVHTEEYIERVVAGTLSADEQRRIGVPWSPGLVQRARAAVFGTVAAAHAAYEHGVAGNLAGGSHHAFRDRGEGYCVFNDIAVAIGDLRAHGRAKRPLIVDLDVHQGNGTAAIFADDASVFTLSLHGATNFPLRKERSTRDVEFADGAEDWEYIGALDRALPDALHAHRPDVVFYQAGVDALADDALGRLALSPHGLAVRDARVFAQCAERAIPVVITMGGGYARPIERSIHAHANVWRSARARDHT